MFEILWLIFLYSFPMEGLNYAAKPRQSDYCVGHELGEFVAHPNDCMLFYWCGENGEALIAACPSNMFFNSQTKLCDIPENAQCERTTTMPSTISIATSPSPTIISIDVPSHVDQYCYNFYATQRNSYALVFLPHPRNCELYYMCYHGQALLQACSSDLHWNSKLGKCDLPSNSECLRTGLEEGEEENTEALSSLDQIIWGNGIKCPSYGEHIFPNIKRCDSFIYCIKGQAILQVCPFYQFFDVRSTRCMLRPKATCVKDLNLVYRKRNV